MTPASAPAAAHAPSLRCRVAGDVLQAGALRLTVQRIGLSHWQPGSTLRSWGALPLHRRRDGALWVPCPEGEAVWLGGWLEGDGGRAGPAGAVTLRVEDPADGARGTIDWPGQAQLAALVGRDGRRRPMTLTRSSPAAARTTAVAHGTDDAAPQRPTARRPTAPRPATGESRRALRLTLSVGDAVATLALWLVAPLAWAAAAGRAPPPWPIAAPPPPPRLDRSPPHPHR